MPRNLSKICWISSEIPITPPGISPPVLTKVLILIEKITQAMTSMGMRMAT